MSYEAALRNNHASRVGRWCKVTGDESQAPVALLTIDTETGRIHIISDEDVLDSELAYSLELALAGMRHCPVQTRVRDVR